MERESQGNAPYHLDGEGLRPNENRDRAAFPEEVPPAEQEGVPAQSLPAALQDFCSVPAGARPEPASSCRSRFRITTKTLLDGQPMAIEPIMTSRIAVGQAKPRPLQAAHDRRLRPTIDHRRGRDRAARAAPAFSALAEPPASAAHIAAQIQHLARTGDPSCQGRSSSQTPDAGPGSHRLYMPYYARICQRAELIRAFDQSAIDQHRLRYRRR